MRINSFSAFGEKKVGFLSALPLLIRQHHTLYPDWKMHLYLDSQLGDTPLEKSLAKMHEVGLIHVKVVNNGGLLSERTWKCIQMLWRMIPVWDADSEYVFCRDLDSILTPRQAKFVMKFIQTGRAVHGINDNEQHSIPLMGGMCGFKCKPFLDLARLSTFDAFIRIPRWDEHTWNQQGADQNLLNWHIWPRVQQNALIERTEGPNDRSHQKNPYPELVLNVHQTVLEEGDNFTNYIGASNCNNDAKGWSTTPEMIGFYNTFGNIPVMEQITKIESDLGMTW